MIVLTNVIGILIELFIPIVLLKKLGELKFHLRSSIVFLITVFVIQLLNNTFFLTKSYIVMLISLTTIFLISLMFKINLRTRIFATIFIFVVGALSETLIGVVFTLAAKVNMTELQTNPILFFICTLASKFLQLTIVRSINFKKTQTNLKSNFKNSLDLFPLPFASLIILLLLFECCYQITDRSFQLIVMISSLILIAANIFIFNLLEKKSDYINTKNQLAFTQKHIEDQIQHYEELYKYQNEIKKFRHDIKNWSTALLALLENNCITEAITFTQEKLNLILEPDNTLIFSTNPVIDAIIQAKIKTASSFGIEIIPTVIINTEIQINQIELGVIIGNGLDNAIEATDTLNPNISPKINIKIISVGEQLAIEITNPVPNNIDTNKLVSTKPNPENHGFGLQSIRTIAQKYNGELFLSCEHNIFKLNATLSNRKATLTQKTST